MLIAEREKLQGFTLRTTQKESDRKSAAAQLPEGWQLIRSDRRFVARCRTFGGAQFESDFTLEGLIQRCSNRAVVESKKEGARAGGRRTPALANRAQAPASADT